MAYLEQRVVLTGAELPAGFWDLGVVQCSEPGPFPATPTAHLIVTVLTFPALAALGFAGPVHFSGITERGESFCLWVVLL